MLGALKRLLAGGSADAKASGNSRPRAGAEVLNGWSRKGQVQIRTPREGEGLIVDGKCAEVPWRLEWGPSQRPYVLGSELRIRAELPLPSDLQLIVLNKTLQEAIEKAMFDQFVEGVQTRIDTETPAEMRWVVMFPKLKPSELGDLRDRYSAVSSTKPWLQAWLKGALTDGLLNLKSDTTTAWVLMISRSRLTLRTEVEEPAPGSFEPHLRLFELALREAQRVGNGPPADDKA